MILKTFLVFGCIALTFGYDDKCITYEKCLENPDAASSIFHENKQKLIDVYTNEIIFVNDAHVDAITHLNKEIQESDVEECKHLVVDENSNVVMETAFKYCSAQAHYCSSQNDESILMSRRKRDLEQLDCLDDSTQYCLNMTAKNRECEEIDLQIHILEECEYLKMFDEIYRQPWENCIARFSHNARSDGECNWYQDVLSKLEKPEVIDLILLRQKEILKRLIELFKLNIPSSQIEKILSNVQGGDLENILNLSKQGNLQINDILKTIKSEQYNDIIEAIKSAATGNHKDLKTKLIELLKKLNLKLDSNQVDKLIKKLIALNVNWNSETDLAKNIQKILNIENQVTNWIKTLKIDVSSEQLAEILSKLDINGINWSSENDIILNLEKILSSVLPEWKIRKDLVLEIVNQLGLALTPQQITNLLISLNTTNINWSSKTDVLDGVKRILKVKVDTTWEARKNWVEEYLGQLHINLDTNQLNAFLEKVKTTNIDWSSNDDVIYKIESIINEFVPEWELRIKLVSKLLTQLHLTMTPNHIINLVIDLSRKGVDWNNETEVLEQIQTLVNIDVNVDKEWETYKNWVEEFLAKLHINLDTNQLNVILEKVKTGNIDWSSDDDVISKLEEIINENVPEWELRIKFVTKLLEQLNVPTSSKDLIKLVIHLSTNGVDWSNENEVLNKIRNLLKTDENVDQEWEAHKKWIEEFLTKLQINLNTNQINEILEKVKSTNINWSSSDDIISNIEKIINEYVPEWELRIKLVTKLLEKLNITMPSKDIINFVIHLSTSGVNWNSEPEVLKNIGLLLNIDV